MEIPKENKEYLEKLKTNPPNELDSFTFISKKISFLLMFIKIVNNHPEELEDSYKKQVNSNKIEPAVLLRDYILLEIRNFYYVAFKRFEHDITYPPSAEINGIVINFRNNVVGHMLPTNSQDVVKWYEDVNKYGFDKIYLEWEEFKDKIYELLKK